MNFTSYVREGNYKLGDIFYLNKEFTDLGRVEISVNPYEEDNIVYCQITLINNNKSISGTILNADVIFNELHLSLTNPYTSNEYSHFMWSAQDHINIVGNDTKKDLYDRFPHWFL